MRQRIHDVDEDAVVDAMRRLIRFAQTGEGASSDAPQRIIEAVQLAHDAARARRSIEEGRSIPPRWLAALGGVATSRVRQLVREGVLRRAGSGIELEAAKTWLEGVQRASTTRVRSLTGRRLVAVKPSWWDNHAWTIVFEHELAERARPLLPDGYRLQFDFRGTPYFEVEAGVMTHDEVEDWRARIREGLEPFDPDKGGWTSQTKAPIHY